MLVVGIAALVLVVVAALWLRFQAPPTLAVSRRVHPDRLHVGSEGRIDLLVENLGTRATPLLAATDWFDEGRRAARFLVPPLAAGATARAPRTASPPVGAAATAWDRSPSRSTDPFGVRAAQRAQRRRSRTGGAARACTTSWRRSRSGAGSAPSTKPVRRARGGERPRRRVRHPPRVRARRRPAPRALALDRPHRRPHDPPGRSAVAVPRRGRARREPRRAHDAESFEVAVEAARIGQRGDSSRSRRRVELVTECRRGAGHRWRSPSRRRRHARHRRSRRSRPTGVGVRAARARTDASTS